MQSAGDGGGGGGCREEEGPPESALVCVDERRSARQPRAMYGSRRHTTPTRSRSDAGGNAKCRGKTQ